MKQWLIVLCVLLCWSAPAQATLYYIDGRVGASGNGLSWGTAWKTIANITGVVGGDTVYFSGAVSGQTYTAEAWSPAQGTVGNPVTYAAGQDSGHTGMVTFTGTTSFISGTIQNVTLNGELNGTRNMTISSAYVNYAVYDNTTGDKHVRLLYLNFSNGITARGQYWELAYSSGIAGLALAGGDDSFIMYMGEINDVGFGTNSIHHNYLSVNRIKTSGLGQDMFKWIGNVDIYNNTLIAVYNAGYTGFQHGDGIQTASNYVRIYNNYFENFISYSIFNEIFQNMTHWRIYNNVMKSDEAGVDWNAYICIQVSGAFAAVISDYIVANNTCAGGPSTDSFSLKGIHLNQYGFATLASDVYFVDNLLYRFPETVAWVGPGTPTVSNNVSGTTNLAFVNDAVYPNNNFRLTASATAAINQGIGPSYLTSVYTTDADGYTRSVGAWDLGAYEYGSAPASGTSRNLAGTRNAAGARNQAGTRNQAGARTAIQ